MLTHLTPLELQIYLLKERHPDTPIYRVARKLKISPQRASRILKKLGMNGVESFSDEECMYMENLSVEERIQYLNRNWKAIPYRYHHLLDEIPIRKLVPIHRFQKLLFQIQVKGESPEEIIKELEKLEREYVESGLLFSYYQLLLLKMHIYNFTGRKEETLRIFRSHEKVISKLPYHLMKDYLNLTLNASLHTGDTALSRRLLKSLERFLNSRRGKDDDYLREYLTDAYIVMGNYLKAMELSSGNPIRDYRLLRFTGRYRDMLRKEPPSPPTLIERFFITLDTSYALLFTGNPGKALLNLLPVYSKLENKYKTAMRNFHIFMAAYNAVLENDGEKRSHLIKALELSEGYIEQMVRAFLSGNMDGDFPSRDLKLLKDWLDGRIGRAVERARRYGGLWILHMTAVFHPKPLSRLHRYRELEPVLGLMKMPLLRLNIFSAPPVIHFMGRKKPLGRSRTERYLIKLIMEGGQMDADRMDARTANGINRLLGKRLVWREDGTYRLHARLQSDYFRFVELYRKALFARNNGMTDEFRKSVILMKRLFQCIPFQKISFHDRELDDYRTSIKLMMEEVLEEPYE